MTARELNRYVAEYPSILRRAGEQKWLSALIEAHATICDWSEAGLVLGQLIEAKILPDFKLRFRKGRGRAKFRYGQYTILLPREPGTCGGRLRIGLVLHEAAHVIDHVKRSTFGHGPAYCQELNALLFNFKWRREMGKHRAIYDRHRGPYTLLLTREITKTVKGKETLVQESDKLPGPFSAENAHEEARLLLGDPRDTVVQVYVYSMTENQFIGAFYKRGEVIPSWEEETDGSRLELPHEQPDAALLREQRSEPLPEVVAAECVSVSTGALPGPVSEPVPDVLPEKKPRKRPSERFPSLRGRPLTLSQKGQRPEEWPPSEPAQLVRAFFLDGRRATPAEVVTALGEQLKALGMDHPDSLVSRLKQASLLEVA